MYNPYADKTDNLDKLEPYTTQYEFKFLAIDGVPISSSNDLGPTSSSSFAYTDKVTPARSKDLVLDQRGTSRLTLVSSPPTTIGISPTQDYKAPHFKVA